MEVTVLEHVAMKPTLNKRKLEEYYTINQPYKISLIHQLQEDYYDDLLK